MNVRIIPRLDIKGPNLVKGINFEGLRVLGKPEYFAKHYYENGADELIYIDAVASLYGRNSLNHIIERTAREIFVPLVVGGGLRSLDDIREILRAGADKVAINTAAVRRPELIREAARAFGSSTIVVSIEAIRKRDGTYEQYTDYGRERTGLDAFEWAAQAVELGAGELLVTSINQEGTGKGFDLELTNKIARSVAVPVIASGGAGALNHVSEVVIEGKADAVSMASMFHYNCAKHCQFNHDDFHEEGNVEFLRKGVQGPRMQDASILETKEHLRNSGLDCRLP
ncbi:MAG: imidazole glycerol phosphate synthase cyclase subunit [Candidatus Marsarchaeota archaeon]|nr:imidazole glycerol phosphate synthase cyclase subunit [Candidatus Marsarchaeota archaeon]